MADIGSHWEGCWRAHHECAVARIEELEAAIRRHRDYRRDNRCWLDDCELYSVLPEGYTPPEKDTAVELERCKRFIASRENPDTEYISPQRRIEELEAALKPFSEFFEKHPWKASVDWPMDCKRQNMELPTLGDCRRAAEVLKGGSS